MKLTTVISGGQTGADRAGLDAARSYGIPTGGWMPKGFRALDGFHPEFAELYGMVEDTHEGYRHRTGLNVEHSDGTVRFAGNWNSPGERCTLSFIRFYGQPSFDLDVMQYGWERQVADLIHWLDQHNIAVLNVAGNSESTWPGIYLLTKAYLTAVFTELGLKSSA